MTGSRASLRREWCIGLLFALLAICLTWPLAASPDRAVSVRGDYFSNLWNFWWMRTALAQGSLPWWTDVLHFPLGIDLARHTLSPVNALPGGVLAAWIGPHDAFKVLLLVHFWLSGWFFFLLARRLSGSTGGAVLAGIVWSFSPFHGYYFAQMNLAAMEFIPLAAFFMVRAYRDGGRWNLVGVAVCAGLLAGSCSYYLVYVALLGVLLLAGGRLWSPGLPWTKGAGRLVASGVAAAAVVIATSWPLISAALDPGTASEGLAALRREPDRSNDLFGFLWVGGPEQTLVSWPTMLGYSTLALLVVGFRRVLRQPFWIGVLVLFFVLSLGSTLSVGGEQTGRGLPYAWLAELPVLSMLRKPDRLILMVEFALAMLVAHAWADLSARLASARWRRVVWPACALVFALERAPLPAGTFEVPVSPYLVELALDEEVEVVLELAPQGHTGTAARRNFLQTIHHKKITEGYVTNLALSAEHGDATRGWDRAYRKLRDKDADLLLKRAREAEVDLIILHRMEPSQRERLVLPGPVSWAPFFLSRTELLTVRQQGPYLEAPMRPADLTPVRQTLRKRLGKPIHTDDRIIVFRCEP